MDFDKTSFSVDWFTPGDRCAPKRLSFPKSARISIDDLVPDSPLGFCYSPTEEAVPRSRSFSFIDTPFGRAHGWSNSAPPSPLAPSSDREHYLMYDQDPKPCEESTTNWRAFVSPGLLSVVDECTSCGVELDVSCLDDLDEQLLFSPMESFLDMCWTTAIHDEVTAPAPPIHRTTRSRARSFKCDHERAISPPFSRDYPGSFERIRPLAAKTTLPSVTSPLHNSLPSSGSESHDTSLMFQEKPLAYILYPDPHRSPHPSAHGTQMPHRSRKRDLTLTPPFESCAQSQPSKHCPIGQPKPSRALRVISDACSTFARARRSHY